MNAAYYEAVYEQGFTSNVPNAAELEGLEASNFRETDRDHAGYIQTLQAAGLSPGDRIFDYGCSWGYGSFQLAQAGFEVTGYEVAPSRRRYGREQLGLRVLDNMDEAPTGQFDCFFSAHVLEHVPSPGDTFRYAMAMLRLRGLFVAFMPNGSDACRSVHPNWSQLWGEVHPNFIDDRFLDKAFALSPRAYGSSPVTSVRLPEGPGRIDLDDLTRPELFFVARKTGSAW